MYNILSRILFSDILSTVLALYASYKITSIFTNTAFVPNFSYLVKKFFEFVPGKSKISWELWDTLN